LEVSLATRAGMPVAYFGCPVELRLPVRKVAVSPERLKVGRKGKIYEVEITVSPTLTAEKAREALQTLICGLAEQFHIKTIAATATENVIRLQIMGSPFSWAALLAWLPTILALIGLVMVGVSVWQVIATVPSWVWALLVIGGATFLIGPIIGEWILSEYERIKGGR